MCQNCDLSPDSKFPMMQAKFRAGRRTGAQPARAANNTEILVSDQKYAWAAGLVMYVLLFYMAVPYFLFNPPDDNGVTFTEPNPLYRALKYLVLFCGIALVIRRRSLAALLLRQVNRSEERRVGKEGRSRWSPYH